MFKPTFQIRPEHVEQLMLKGSPMLLRSVGRVFGLGQEETDALSKGQMPTWVWCLAVGTAGFFVGAYVHNKWPGVTKPFGL